MKIKLVFDDWQVRGKSVYATVKGSELSTGDFHAGTTFEGRIELDVDQQAELEQALKAGYQPVFWVTR